MTKPLNSPQHNSQRLQEYLRYSGMAIEMMAIIGIFTFIGYKIDQLLKIEFPIGVILSSLSGLSIALYRIMRSLNRKQ